MPKRYSPYFLHWGGIVVFIGRIKKLKKGNLNDKLAAKEKHGKQLNKMFIEWLKFLQPDSNA